LSAEIGAVSPPVRPVQHQTVYTNVTTTADATAAVETVSATGSGANAHKPE